MGRLIEPSEKELEIVRDNPVITAAGLIGRSRETIRRWRADHLAKPGANRGRPRRKLPEALVAQLGTLTDAELSRRYNIPKNSIRNYRIEHGIPALGTDLLNTGTLHLVVSSMLVARDATRFDRDFPLADLGLQCEPARAEQKRRRPPEPVPPGTFFWGQRAEPFLPRDRAGMSMLDHLRKHLAAGCAVVVATVAPERPLEDANALLVAHDGNIRVGTYGALLDAPGDYAVARPPAHQLLEIPLA